MARRYHSPSSIALGERCAHAWALRYVGGWREPDVTWAEIEAGAPHEPRQRSLALGKAVHAVLEEWYRGGDPDWESLPGQIAHSGLHLLPHRDACHEVFVEEPIGREALPPPPPPPPPATRRDALRQYRSLVVATQGGAPAVGLRVHGVMWAGFRDLLVRPTAAELRRLGLDPDRVKWLQIDHKSCANIDRYALRADELREDPQCNLYAIDLAERLGLERVHSRWVYYESKRVRRAAATDVEIVPADAYEVMRPRAGLAWELDKITRVEDAPRNLQACGDYGGRPCHISAGGPCDARRSTGSLIQARVIKKDRQPMAISAEAKAKFAAAKAAAAAAAGTATTTTAAATEAAPVNATTGKPAKPRPTRAKAPPPPPEIVEPEPEEAEADAEARPEDAFEIDPHERLASASEAHRGAHAALVAAQLNEADARAELDAAIAALREAIAQ